MEKKTSFNLAYLFIALFAVVMVRDAWVSMNQVQTIPYSEFQNLLKAGKVKEIAILDNFIQGNNQDPVNWGPLTLSFASGIAGLSDSQYASSLTQSYAVGADTTRTRLDPAAGTRG